MTHPEITARVQYLQELRRMSEDLTREIETVQNDIKAHMTEHSLTELVAGPFRVTWATASRTAYSRISVRSEGTSRQIFALMTPPLRIRRVSARVSTPAMAGIPWAASQSLSVPSHRKLLG